MVVGATSTATTASALFGDDLDFVSVNVDVADPDSVQWRRDEADRRVDVADVLVNNAALFATVPMSRVGYQELSVDEWGFLMAVNLRGVWLMTRAFVAAMPQRGYGKVINVSSSTASKVSANRIHYVTSKAGIFGFTKTLAREVDADGVAVNCIAPGSTLSEDVGDQGDDVLGRRSWAASSRALPRVKNPRGPRGHDRVLRLAGQRVRHRPDVGGRRRRVHALTRGQRAGASNRWMDSDEERVR